MSEVYVLVNDEDPPKAYGSLKSLALAIMASDPAIIAAAETLGQEIGKVVRPFANALGEKLPTVGSFTEVSLGTVYRLAILKTDQGGESREKAKPGRKPRKHKAAPDAGEVQSEAAE